jgi:hypothetical protein
LPPRGTMEEDAYCRSLIGGRRRFVCPTAPFGPPRASSQRKLLTNQPWCFSPEPGGFRLQIPGPHEQLPDPCLYVVHTGRVRARIIGLSKRSARRATAALARQPGAHPRVLKGRPRWSCPFELCLRTTDSASQSSSLPCLPFSNIVVPEFQQERLTAAEGV